MVDEIRLTVTEEVPATTAVDEEFLDLLDERWIRDEFEAIVAASWEEPPARVPPNRPPSTPRGRAPHRHTVRRPPRVGLPVRPSGLGRAWARERSPPWARHRFGAAEERKGR